MKILKEYIPITLNKIFKCDEFLEDGGIIISSINYTKDKLELIFNIFYNGYEIPKQQWKIIINGLLKEKIERGWADYLVVYSDHYLLYEFSDIHGDLYFKEKSKNPDKLFIDLYKSYLKNYQGDFLPFGKGINPAMKITRLCNSNAGLFARGPKIILEKYHEVLSENNIRSNIVISESEKISDLKILFFGDSYFIAKSFEFERIG